MTNFFNQQDFFYKLHKILECKEGWKKDDIIKKMVPIFLSSEFVVNSEIKKGKDLFSAHFIKKQIEHISNYYSYGHGLNQFQFVNLYGHELLHKISNPLGFLFITRVGNFQTDIDYACKSLRIIPNNEESINSIIKEYSISSDLSGRIKEKLTIEKDIFQTIIVIKTEAIEFIGYIKINEEGRRTGIISHSGLDLYDHVHVVDISAKIIKKIKFICNFIKELPIFFEGMNIIGSPSYMLIETPDPMYVSFSRDIPGIRIRYDVLRHYMMNYKLEFNAIEELVKKGDNRSFFENKKLQAVYWLGEAIEEDDFHHILLKTIVALESLLINREEKEKGKKIAGISSLLFDFSPTDKKRIHSMIIDAYKKRNDIVHDGINKIENPILIYDLIDFSRDLIKFIITHPRIKSYDDLMSLVETNKKTLSHNRV